MVVDKENADSVALQRIEVKKRQSISSPCSSASPSVRPDQKRLRPLHEICDKNLEATFFSSTFNTTIGSTTEQRQTHEYVSMRSFAFIGDHNLEETAVDLSLCEPRSIQMVESNVTHVDDDITKTSAEVGDSNDLSKANNRVFGTPDRNLDETCVETTTEDVSLIETTKFDESKNKVAGVDISSAIDDTNRTVEISPQLSVLNITSSREVYESLNADVLVSSPVCSSERDEIFNEYSACKTKDILDSDKDLDLVIEADKPKYGFEQSFDVHNSETESFVLRESAWSEGMCGPVSEEQSHSSSSTLLKNETTTGDVLHERSVHTYSADTQMHPVSAHFDDICKNRKYNLNDSDISFLMNENRIYDMALRETTGPAEDPELLRKSTIGLEKVNSELSEKCRLLTEELALHKAKSAEQDLNIFEINKKLQYAERTAADYEATFEIAKNNYIKEKEGLYKQILFLESELEKRQDLHISEIATLNGNIASMEVEIAKLEEMVKSNEMEILALHNAKDENSLLILKMSEAECALKKSEEEVRELSKQLVIHQEQLALLREVQAASELDLINKSDEINDIRNALKQSEESRAQAFSQSTAIEKEMNSLKLKLAQFSEEQQTMERLKSEYATVHESLDVERKVNSDLACEVNLLRNEKFDLKETIERLNSLLEETELRATAAESDLMEHTKCHKEELNNKIAQLECLVSTCSAEKEFLEKKLTGHLQEKELLSLKLEKILEALGKFIVAIKEIRKTKDDLHECIAVSMKQLHKDNVSEIEKLGAVLMDSQSERISLISESNNLKEQLLAMNEERKKDVLDAEKAIESLKTDVAIALSENEILSHRLATAENLNKDSQNSLAKLNLVLDETQKKLNALLEEKINLEQIWNEKEYDYIQKIVEFDKLYDSKVALESTVEILKSDVYVLKEELLLVNEELRKQVASNEKAAVALTTLEQQHSVLKKEKEDLIVEFEKRKERFIEEISTAEMNVENLQQEISELRGILSDRKAAESVRDSENHNNLELERLLKIKTSEVERLAALCDEFDEIENSYKQQISALSQERDQLRVKILHPINDKINNGIAASMERKPLTAVSSAVNNVDNLESKYNESVVKENEELRRRCISMEERISELEQQSRNHSDACEELKRIIRVKTTEVERLGVLCDEFDEIENDYKHQLSALTKERGELIAKLSQLVAKEAGNQGVGHSEKIEKWNPDISLSHSVRNLSLKSDGSIVMENQELKRRCVLLEEKVIHLEKLWDDTNSAKNARDEISGSRRPTALEDVLSGNSHQNFGSNFGILNTSVDIHDNAEARKMVPFSKKHVTVHPDSEAGPEVEESSEESVSCIERAGATDRTLRTTRFEKTTKLSESLEAKMNNSRCSQQ